MTKYIGRTVVVAWLAITYGFSVAEETRELPKIGELYGSNPSASKPYDDAFRTGLRELGYIEGRNVIVLPRYANGTASLSCWSSSSQSYLFRTIVAAPSFTRLNRMSTY